MFNEQQRMKSQFGHFVFQAVMVLACALIHEKKRPTNTTFGMGIKLEYTIKLLGTSRSRNRFTVHFVDDHLDNFSTARLKNNRRTSEVKFLDTKNRMGENQDLESIRKTMQFHEETFKHQVRELHRLYSIQKMLMNDLKMETRRSKGSTAMTGSDVNSFQFIEQHLSVTKTNLHILHPTDNPNSRREQSGSCSGDTLRVLRGFDLQRPAEEDVSTGVIAPRSEKMSISRYDVDSEVELTLSIGGASSSSASGKKSKDFLSHGNLQLGSSESTEPKEIRELDSSALFKSERGEDCSTPTTPMSSSSAMIDQESKQQHWLFRGSSINRK